MITRYALFEGAVHEGQTAAFQAAVKERLAPIWATFPGACEVRVMFGAERDEGAPEFPLVLAISYPDRAAMGLAGGQLIVNPIPEAHEIPRAEIMPVVEEALRAAKDQGIAAKDVTPFLLQRIFETTEGRSLTANIELVLNNARLAAQVAVADAAR